MANLKEGQFKDFSGTLGLTYPATFFEYLKLYRFNDAFFYIKSKEVLPPPVIIQKETKIDYEKLANIEGKEKILEFIYVLQNHFPPKDLIIFLNNLKSLQINPADLEDKDKIAKYFDACYDGANNTIFFKANSDYLYHELFHVATCISTNGIRYTGFKQYCHENNYFLGSGLNEGYTELLTRRYFAQKLSNNHPYNYLTHIASLVEVIVGEAKMQSLYLSANLRGLIYELQKYNSREEIIDFLLMLDHLNSIITYKEAVSKISSQIKWYFNKIYEFLVKTYAQKLIVLYKEGNITMDMVNNLISEFISTFASYYIIMNVSFKAVRNNVLEHILQTTLECPDLYLQVKKVRKRKKNKLSN